MWVVIVALAACVVIATYEALEWRIRAEALSSENISLSSNASSKGCQHEHRHSIDCPGVTVKQLREQAAENGRILMDFQALGDNHPIPQQRRGEAS